MEREFNMEEGKEGEEAGLDDSQMRFGDKAVRRGFIRKVYAILSVQVRLGSTGPRIQSLVLLVVQPLVLLVLLACSSVFPGSLTSPILLLWRIIGRVQPIYCWQ